MGYQFYIVRPIFIFLNIDIDDNASLPLNISFIARVSLYISDKGQAMLHLNFFYYNRTNVKTHGNAEEPSFTGLLPIHPAFHALDSKMCK